MPRTRRLIPTDAAMHIICKGNNSQNILNTDKDKSYYYSLIREFKKDNKITIFHYCLMSNHIHLIVWLEALSRISRFMKQVNLIYCKYYNKKYGYSGHLWQGRFKSNIIDTDSYLLQCGKYIELNPVRAGIVNSPEEYKFSSYNYYARGLYDPIVTSSPVYLELSNSIEGRRKQYIEFVIDSSIINEENFTKRVFIGSENFVRKLEGLYGVRNLMFSREILKREMSPA